MKEIVNNVYYVGCNDKVQKYFDAFIPIPYGTSYNSYLIFGENKTALIDTSEDFLKDEFLNNLAEFQDLKIDYLIMLHTEPDHASIASEVLKKWPDATLVTTSKAYEIGAPYFDFPDFESIIIVKDNDTLNLGQKTLLFKTIPFSHWPDQLTAYLIEDKILFSSDFFGAHQAIGDDVVVEPNVINYETLKAYYAQIMMPLQFNARKNLTKLLDYELNYIAPAHGPIFNDPKYVLNSYQTWVDDDQRDKTILLYISTHGTVKKMSDIAKSKIHESHDNFKVYDLEDFDYSELIQDLVDCKKLILGTPAILGAAHPKLLADLTVINALKPKITDVYIYGSFGWSQSIMKSIEAVLTNIKPETIEWFFVKGPINDENRQDFDDFLKLI